jgi:hypothetical protein
MSTGCTSSGDSPPHGAGELIVVGGGGREQRGVPPREVESPTPVSTGHEGSRGAGAHGGRGRAYHQAFSGGARGRRGGAGERDRDSPRALE